MSFWCKGKKDYCNNTSCCDACAYEDGSGGIELEDDIIEGIISRRWISVKDRLPEKQKPVLVCAKDKTFGYQRTLKAAHIGYRECSTKDYGWQEYEGDTEYDEHNGCFWIPECWYETNAVEDNVNWIIDYDYEVTHWMPLPEPPKE